MEKLLEMKPFKALLKAVGECLDFKGRTSRSDFWWAVLGMAIVSFVISFLLGFISAFMPDFIAKILSLLSTLVSLAVCFLGIGLDIRRLHDVNKSGWFILVSLIPLVGAIYLIYLDCQPSFPQDNQYGPVPVSVTQ